MTTPENMEKALMSFRNTNTSNPFNHVTFVGNGNVICGVTGNLHEGTHAVSELMRNGVFSSPKNKVQTSVSSDAFSTVTETTLFMPVNDKFSEKYSDIKIFTPDMAQNMGSRSNGITR